MQVCLKTWCLATGSTNHACSYSIVKETSVSCVSVHSHSLIVLVTVITVATCSIGKTVPNERDGEQWGIECVITVMITAMS